MNNRTDDKKKLKYNSDPDPKTKLDIITKQNGDSKGNTMDMVKKAKYSSEPNPLTSFTIESHSVDKKYLKKREDNS